MIKTVLIAGWPWFRADALVGTFVCEQWYSAIGFAWPTYTGIWCAASSICYDDPNLVHARTRDAAMRAYTKKVEA